MSLLHPKIYLDSVTGLNAALLDRLGVKWLILDVDNTLTTHDNPIPDPAVLLWLDDMRAAGIRMVILSNNNPPRIEPFARILRLPFTANAAKPLPFGYRRAARTLGLPLGEAAVVGDQIFTDILGGNLLGITTVLVKPIMAEDAWFFRVKRRLERGILKRYRPEI